MPSLLIRQKWFRWVPVILAMTVNAAKIAMTCDRTIAPGNITTSQFKVRVNGVVRAVTSALGSYEAVTNGKFDTSITGWTNLNPAVCNLHWAGGEDEKYVYATDLGSGFVADLQATITQYIPVSAAKRGQKVDFKCDFLIAGGQAASGIVYAAVDSMPGNVPVASIPGIQGDGTWHRGIEDSGVIPADSVGMNVYLVYYPLSAISAGGAFPAFDNVSLEVGNVVEITLASPVVAGDKVDIAYLPSNVLTDVVIEAASDGLNLPAFERTVVQNVTP